MARRKVRSGRIMEWTTETANIAVPTTTPSVTLTTIDLDLLPDEIAEILMVEENLHVEQTAEIDGIIEVMSALSMDPGTAMTDFITGGATQAAQLEDLEVFWTHHFAEVAVAAGTPASYGVFKENDIKQTTFPEPILVGTNIGWNLCCVETADISGDLEAVITIYFKRRRATAQELNQVLLKRR